LKPSVYRVRLSTIVRADHDNRVLESLCYRVDRRRFSSSNGLLKPVVVIDVVPDEEDQRLAAGFLDMFAPVMGAICEPSFIFKDGISKDRLEAFFKEYERNMQRFYRKYFFIIKCDDG